jgi:hypothetical protein
MSTTVEVAKAIHASRHLPGGEDPLNPDVFGVNPSLLARSAFPLTRLRGKLAGVQSGEVATLMTWGDSVMLSLVPSDVFYQLYAQYGFRGVWLQASESQSEVNGIGTSGATVITDQWAFSLSGMIYRLDAVNEAVSFTVPPDGACAGARDRRVNRATVVYAVKPGGGTFKLQYCRGKASRFEGAVWADVAGATAISTANAVAGVATHVVNFPTLDDNSVRAVWVSGGETDIVGAELENTGVGGFNLALSGKGGMAMSSTTTNMSNATLTTILGVIAPDLIYTAWKDETTPAAITPVLAAMQSKFNACYPTQWLFCAPYPDSVNSSAVAVRALADAYIAHAKAGGHAWFDPCIEAPDYATAVALGIMGDSTHFNVKGQRLVGNKLWLAANLLPSPSEARSGADVRYKSVDADALAINGRSLAQALYRLKQTDRLRFPFLRFLPGQEGSVRNFSFGSAFGTGSFTALAEVRVVAGLGTHYPMALRVNAFGGGQQAGNVFLQIRSADIMVQHAADPGLALTEYVFPGAHTDYWALTGNIVSLALRRDAGVQPGEHAYTLFINGKRYSPFRASGSGSQTDSVAGQVCVLGNTNGAVAVVGGPTVDLFGGGFWNTAVTDEEIIAWSLTGGVPASPLYFFPLDDAAGELTRGSGYVVKPQFWTNRLISSAGRVGSATLAAGFVFIPDTDVKENTIVIITRRNRNGSPNVGELDAKTRTIGVGFQISARDTAGAVFSPDVSTVDYAVFYLQP